MLALITDPSLIAHARPVDTFPGWTALVTRFGRGSVREEDQVKQHVQQQVSMQTSQLTASAVDLASPPRIHFQYFINFLIFALHPGRASQSEHRGLRGLIRKVEALAAHNALVALEEIRGIPPLSSILKNENCLLQSGE